MSFNPTDYFVSETLGFVLENPLTTLPDYFEAWNRLATDMAQLVAANTMRQQVEQMALLDWTKLEGHRQKRLAHFQLTVIASGYVWQNGDKGASKTLPACVAVPLYRLSEDLGLPPVICHPGLALANYAPIDPTKPLILENLRALYHLPGGEEAEWFCIATTMVELTFARCIKSVMAALRAVENDDVKTVTSNITHITEVVRDMQTAVSRLHDKLTSDTFFNTLRPFLGGWGGENNPLPDGLIYLGVADQPIHAIGGSAAQSPTMQVLDALAGVQHAQDKRAFLLSMRGYMPPAHRRFIEAVENQKKTLHSLLESSKDEELHKTHNALLSAMVDFRSYHIQIVTKYIVQASSKVKQSDEKRFESLDQKGTGGTSILPFLKELRQDTKDQMAGANASGDSIINSTS
ncbi:myoglobin-like [Littorina saxatilis]|uniref:Indoleamine 2,3-dioxygenase n=1 Tax=Littorina saxatilis TaxID=31220 RepID=A0AAN9GK36_9CAEN